MVEINTAFEDYKSPEHSNLSHRWEFTIFTARKTVKKKTVGPKGHESGRPSEGTLVGIEGFVVRCPSPHCFASNFT
jgi:hypothetical protein